MNESCQVTPERDRPDPERHVLHAESMASLGSLAAAVAHELNNPLSGIVMYARLVERELGNLGLQPETREELCRYLSQVQADARHCGTIVGNVLRFARAPDGDVARHHVNDIVEESLALVRHCLAIAHVDVETVALDGDDLIDCDAGQLQQALVALLLNSAAAMPGGGRARVRVAGADRTICVEISANPRRGPSDTPSHAVEPRAQGATSARALGLPGVDIIVRRHRGSIEIEPTADNGRRVRLRLPQRPPCAARVSA